MVTVSGLQFAINACLWAFEVFAKRPVLTLSAMTVARTEVAACRSLKAQWQPAEFALGVWVPARTLKPYCTLADS